MTEAAPPQPTLNSEVHEYVKVWTETLAQVLTQMAGVPFALESVLASPPETPVPQESDRWAMVAAAGSLRGEMSLRVPSVVVLAVGQLLLQESPDAAAGLKPDHLDAVQEFLRQAAGLVATSLSPRLSCGSRPERPLLHGRLARVSGWSPHRRRPAACCWNGS
jgi:hypothetical protein